jgi:hypothetical protein
MVTLSRVTIDGNLGLPYVVTLDRVTIYREALLFIFFNCEMNPVRATSTHPIGENFGPVRRALGIDHDGIF